MVESRQFDDDEPRIDGIRPTIEEIELDRFLDEFDATVPENGQLRVIGDTVIIEPIYKEE